MFLTVHLHISYGPYDRLRYQDAGRSTWNVQKGVKTKVMTMCKQFPKLYMQSEVNSDVLGWARIKSPGLGQALLLEHPTHPAPSAHTSCPLCPCILSPSDASYMSCPSAHTFCPPLMCPTFSHF